MGWGRVVDVKIAHEDHARIETMDTIEKHVVGIGYDRIDFFQLVHMRQLLVKIRVWWSMGCRS
jgi:hypothetical protein